MAREVICYTHRVTFSNRILANKHKRLWSTPSKPCALGLKPKEKK